MTPAATRDRRITIERDGGEAEDDFGKPAPGWAPFARPFARVLYGTGSERRAAGAEGASQTATFNVLAHALTRAVTTADRISFGGAIWDITGVTPLGRDAVEYIAIRKGPA